MVYFPSAQDWDIFANWLKEEEEVAKTIREEMTLFNDLVSLAAKPIKPKPPPTKLTNTVEHWPEDEEFEKIQQAETTCVTQTNLNHYLPAGRELAHQLKNFMFVKGTFMIRTFKKGS